uniref:Homeobox protein HAT3.1 n=1 Tax=Noccaea caerulescens TaxID=107243 RepID=A0A1J3DFP0_NOCCA
MHRADRRRRRSSESVLEQTNGECGGEVNPAVDKASEQSNGSVPLNQSEADNHTEETPNVGNEISNGHLREEMVENGGKGISNGFSGEEEKPTPETGKKRSDNRSSGSHRELVFGLPCKGQFEIFRSRNAATSSKRLGGGGGERNVQFSSYKRAQRSKEAAASSSVDANSTPVDRPKKRKKDIIKKGKVVEDDEYTRIKKKLRYLLNRINYEQSLIDAYSLQGWKGSSLEKLRPEKELERATKEIMRRKVKIRDLFQHLDTLCAEGSLPEALFDSDGKISSEDIFCAKCGSEDLSVDNDIILCDGFCDRGFHQNCVEPPLRKEDIPPDDESWLCPGCDCKDDSFVLLNDSLGTKLSVSDSWEKVFPEAAAAMTGGDQNVNCDLPSDDSDDEEYDPDGLNDNENDEDGSDDSDESENEDGSSDESDFTSASDEMIGSFKEAKDIMDLPSDDSEDDDYDPDAPAQDKTQESSNSDCTSDSEDLETSLNDDESNQQDEVTPRGKPGRKKSQLPDVSISEADAPGRRKVERLDYKKLYDEEYENVSSSSSEDEDWDKTAGKEDYESADERDTVPLKQSLKAEDHTSSKKPLKRANNKDNTLKAPQEAPRENGYSGGKSSSSANKQRLLKSFEENRYPDITTREGLAKELQMTVKQVTTWFTNTRFSTSKKMVSEEETSVAGSSEQIMETELVTENKSRASESTSTGSRKRRRR